jgi:hypothetical protein
MGSLGSFGVRHEAVADEVEPDTFDWFDLEVRLTTTYNQVELVDLMEIAATVDEEDPRALVIVKDLLRMFIEPDDFDAFWQKAREEKQTIEDLSALMQGLMVAVTDRPTQPLSDSSAGQPTTITSLPVASATPASRGRPDLQLLVDGAAATWAKVEAEAAG